MRSKAPGRASWSEPWAKITASIPDTAPVRGGQVLKVALDYFCRRNQGACTVRVAGECPWPQPMAVCGLNNEPARSASGPGNQDNRSFTVHEVSPRASGVPRTRKARQLRCGCALQWGWSDGG